MTGQSNRRDFLKSGIALAATTLVGTTELKPGFAETTTKIPQIVAAKGPNRFNSTRKALGLLQAKTAITPGATVGLLANSPSWWKTPGSFTHPDIVLATVLMCIESGAKEIRFLLDPAEDFWRKTKLSKKYKKEIAAIKGCSGSYVEKRIARGKSLKTVKIIKDLFECDAFINLPIIKHHTGCHMSCNLKNMMGANTHESNQFFHHGSGAKDSYGDIPFLSQCIADLNTLRPPTLCVVDGTEVLATNGPSGPGKLLKPHKVIVGTDPVAIDTYCAKLLGLKPQQIPMIKRAANHGLGTMKLEQLRIEEITVS